MNYILSKYTLQFLNALLVVRKFVYCFLDEQAKIF